MSIRSRLLAPFVAEAVVRRLVAIRWQDTGPWCAACAAAHPGPAVHESCAVIRCARDVGGRLRQAVELVTGQPGE